MHSPFYSFIGQLWKEHSSTWIPKNIQINSLSSLHWFELHFVSDESVILMQPLKLVNLWPELQNLVIFVVKVFPELRNLFNIFLLHILITVINEEKEKNIDR